MLKVFMVSKVNILQFVGHGVSQFDERPSPSFEVIVCRTFPKVAVSEVHPGAPAAGSRQGYYYHRDRSWLVLPLPGKGQLAVRINFPIDPMTNKFGLIGIPEFDPEGAPDTGIRRRAEHPALRVRTKPGHPGRVSPGLPNEVDGGFENGVDLYFL
jgi:hypothetical protein